MRQDKLDLVELVLALPVLHGVGPAVARIAQAVDEDDGRRVSARGRKHHGRGAANRRHYGGRCGWGWRMRKREDSADGWDAETTEQEQCDNRNQRNNEADCAGNGPP